jgi:hypothetical protein
VLAAAVGGTLVAGALVGCALAAWAFAAGGLVGTVVDGRAVDGRGALVETASGVSVVWVSSMGTKVGSSVGVSGTDVSAAVTMRGGSGVVDNCGVCLANWPKSEQPAQTKIRIKRNFRNKPDLRFGFDVGFDLDFDLVGMRYSPK